MSVAGVMLSPSSMRNCRAGLTRPSIRQTRCRAPHNSNLAALFERAKSLSPAWRWETDGTAISRENSCI